MKPFNVIKNAIKPVYLNESIRKIVSRILNKSIDKKGRDLSIKWCEANLSDWENFAVQMNQDLFLEAKKFETNIVKLAKEKEELIEMKVGGAGHYPLLYFFARLHKPQTVVETGVAFGFSSRAFLEAIKINGSGSLYSSDLPYFRLNDPEKVIGIMVDDDLKKNWNLYVEGDRKNIIKIKEDITKIDIFHYDSDKTYDGRKFVLAMLKEYFTSKTIVIMDDIQDNLFFHDYITKEHIVSYKIFKFSGKYIGVIGV